MLLATATLFVAVGPMGIDPAGAAAVPTVELATAGSYSVLAGSAVTNTGPSTLDADLGISPGSAVTGFPPGIIGGTRNVANAAAAQAQADLTAAYVNAAGRSVDATTTADLAGLTLVGGVYSGPAKGALGLTGPLVLDGEGNASSVFIFQTDSSLTTASASTVSLINGAQACNVFWQVGSSATLGTGSTFVGTVLALTSITVTTDVTIRGRMLARNGAVTLDDDQFASSACTAAATTTTSSSTSTTSTTRAPATTTTVPVTPTTAASDAPVDAAGPGDGVPLEVPLDATASTLVTVGGGGTPPTIGLTGTGFQELPRTGASAGVLTIVALGLVALGALAVKRARDAQA